MIVKVQLPLAAHGGATPEALAYNKDRTVEALLPITDRLFEVMDGRHKVFFHAEVQGSNLVIGDEADWQEW